jgi:hypothetical protein
MEKLGKDLPDAAIHTFQNLWPEEKAPNRVEVLAADVYGSFYSCRQCWASKSRGL